MKLLIDVGNSRIKWLYGRALPAVVEAVSCKSNWRERLYRAFHLLPTPQVIALSSVNRAEIDAEIVALAEQLWGLPVQRLQARKYTPQAGLTLAYDPAEKLGCDRYLALLGARMLHREALAVIGCGTAITLDVVDGNGRHLGGAILPGVRLMENALLNHTQKLMPMRWTPQSLGRDTATCIGAGIHHAIPAGIDALLNEREEQSGIYFHRYAFGGDAPILFGNRPHYQLEPDLIFRGMFALLDAATDV